MLLCFVSMSPSTCLSVHPLCPLFQDKMVSIFSKRYFQGYSQFYIAAVFASGDCFVPLWLISSNLFGIPLLNSGLSWSQREKYRAHHLFCVILLRNIPLFVIECYFMFNLGIYSAIVIIGFLATMFSAAVCAVTMLDFYVINKRQIELPFTINLQWEKKRETAGTLSPGDGFEAEDDDEKEHHDAMVAISSRSGPSKRRVPDEEVWRRVKEEPKEVITDSNPLSRVRVRWRWRRTS